MATWAEAWEHVPMRTAVTAVLAAGMGLSAGMLGTAHAATDPVLHGAVLSATSNACPQEDSLNCYWNANVQGDGSGHSFYSIKVGPKDCIIYWDRDFNAAHGYCLPL